MKMPLEEAATPPASAVTIQTTTTTSTVNASGTGGLRRQPTKYPHGLNITVQTVGTDEDDEEGPASGDYSRTSTLKSSSIGSSDIESCWTDTQKYRIGMLGSPETLAELQVRRYKYPLTANYYLNGPGGGAAGSGQAQAKPHPLMLLAYARRACRWKYLRWPIIFLASVLLFFGLITYCLWLHDVSIARARYLQRRYEATLSSTTTDWPAVTDEDATTELPSTTIENLQGVHESTRLKAIDMQTTYMPDQGDTLEDADDDYDDVLLPADSIRFTSGHQNSFGVPIEQDKRMLQLLKDLLPKPQSTPSAYVHQLTRVSPTLPPPSGVSRGRPTEAMTTTPTSGIVSGCISTALPMCRGILDYDLTYSSSWNGAPRDAPSLAAYEELIKANCSARAVEFVCAALEPECRPLHIGQLPPCRRICKAILEACSIVIANSDQLSELFDCSQYPDAHETHKCEDPTRRRDSCFDNEFQCHDGSCIPQQWQCDNIKDCAGGEDEDEQCLVCEHEEFRCRSNEKCIPETLRCNLNSDCFDASDEDDCNDYGSGDAAPYDEIELNAFPRIFSYASFLSPNETNEKQYTYITATTDEEAGTETKFQVHQIAAPPPPPAPVAALSANASSEEATGVPKGFVNFRDSKEIMMTSDSETKFKYSPQRANRTTSRFSLPPATAPTRTASAIPLSALTMQRERERIALSLSSTSSTPSSTSSSTTTLASPTLPTAREPGRCLPHELRCITGECITVDQLCDKRIDCPDATDEIMCVYTERPTVKVITTKKTTPRKKLTAKSTTSTTTSLANSPTTTNRATTTTTPSPTTTMMTTPRRSLRPNLNRSRKPKS